MVREFESTKRRARMLQHTVANEQAYKDLVVNKYNRLSVDHKELSDKYRHLEEEKEHLAIQMMVLEAEKNDSEARVFHLEADKQAMVEQLEQAESRAIDMSPFHELSCDILRQMHATQELITEEVCRLKAMMVRLKEVNAEANRLKGKYTRVKANILSQMEWREGKVDFPKHLPFKSVDGFKEDVALMEFCRNCGLKLMAKIQGTIDKSSNLYQKIHEVHDKCKMSFPQSLDEFPSREQRLSDLKEELGIQIEYVKKIDVLAIDDLHHYIGLSSIYSHLLKEIHQAAVAEIQGVEAELGKHVTSQKILLPSPTNVVIRDTGIWFSYIAEEEKKAAAAVAASPSTSLPAGAPSQG
jgi:hypothetical protein